MDPAPLQRLPASEKLPGHKPVADLEQHPIVGFQTLQGLGRKPPIGQQPFFEDVIPESVDVVKGKLKQVLAAMIQRSRRQLIF